MAANVVMTIYRCNRAEFLRAEFSLISILPYVYSFVLLMNTFIVSSSSYTREE